MKLRIGLVILGIACIIVIALVVRAGGVDDGGIEGAAAQQAESTQTIESGEDAEPSTNLPEQATEFELVAEQSTLTYFAEKIVPGLNHTGTVALKNGSLSYDGESFASGTFVVDMTRITESKNNELYLKHVRSADFFDIENYPNATFELASVDSNTENEYVVNGNLTIKGQTHDQAFTAHASMEGDALRVQAEFKIDRTRWGVNFASGSFFKDLGDNTIKDEITLTLDLVFTPLIDEQPAS